MDFVGEIVMMLVVFLMGCAAVLRWNEMRFRKKGLPPGTMGWPVLGENTDFLGQGPSFMQNRRARYGSVFKSHILGCPTVVSMDPDLNRYILLNEKKGLVPGYPQSMIDILGKSNIAAVHGPLHRVMRDAFLAIFNPNVMRENVFPKIDAFMSSHLSNWFGKIIDIQQNTKEMAFLSAMKQLLSKDKGPETEAFMPEFYKLVSGTLSLPIDLPGTNYRQGIQGRDAIVGMLREILEKRKASPNEHDDILDHILRFDDNSNSQLTEEQIIDLMITIIYSGFETVSTTTMMCVKYLSDNPAALQELSKEHIGIREKKKSPEDPITLEDFKSMHFTRAVIYETMRLAVVVNGLLRKTTQDVELNGFVIPKGWKIYVYIRETNHSDSLYEDPLAFNPWRWLESNIEYQKHFLLFGAGCRLCPGKESGVAEISTFLHYLVTRYRWKQVGGDTLLTFPRVQAPNGLHIKVWDC